MDLLFIIGGLIVLVAGGNWLLKAAVGFSLRLNIPKVVIGMTVVSFATSTPELIVSVNSALNGSADLAFSNVIGSNIANLGLVLGITIFLSTISVEKSFYKTDWPAMILASLLLYVFVAFDGVLQRYEGVILFVSLIVFLVYLLKFKKNVVSDEIPEDGVTTPLYKDLIYMVLGGVALWGGSELLIKGAVNLAAMYNVSESVVGITIVSIGTSIPELAASIIAVIKKEKAISLGNLIGSNIFNILAVLGITSMIIPVKVTDARLLEMDIYWMLGISFVVLPLVFVPKFMKLGRREGLFLLATYFIFIYNIIKIIEY
ncbi:MAG: hypothetical protein COB60_12130 [Flavobacteriaceae bacterium]|nr:MAG: hypothetical protein COB60_12130 [Flavobacteriaceae bacterium]